MGNSGSQQEPFGIATKWYDEYVATEFPSSSFVGKTIAITGCTTGTGFHLAETCVRNGAENVLLLNRQSDRAIAAEKRLEQLANMNSQNITSFKHLRFNNTSSAIPRTKVESIQCDLQDFDSVKKAAETIRKKYESIDILCNNAGVMALEDIATKDGYDVQMQTNHLSHFYLTKELFPLLIRASVLRGEARIVHHSSVARLGRPLKPKYLEKNGGQLGGNGTNPIFGGRWERYHQTKLSNSAFTFELCRKLTASNQSKFVKAVVAAPGWAATNLQQTTIDAGGMGIISLYAFKMIAQSGKDGTMALLAACFHPKTKNGDFWEPSGFLRLFGIPKKVPFDTNSMDSKQGSMLWSKSELACGEFIIT